MKIFNQVEGWDSKVNFVDENNVVLGYDMAQDCCEHAEWWIEEGGVKVESPDTKDWSAFRFDPEYFEDVSDASVVDGGGTLKFRIVAGEREAFVFLQNSQNGYYSHGFEFKVGDSIKRCGSI